MLGYRGRTPIGVPRTAPFHPILQGVVLTVPFSRTVRSLSGDTSRYALLAWGCAAVLLALWAIWFFRGQVTVYEVSRQARLEVERSVHPIAALAAGKIARTSLVLGQEVKAGQILVELDASSETLRLGEEEARAKALPPQIAALRNEIAAQEAASGEDHRAALSALEAARSRYGESVAAAGFDKDQARRLAELGKFGRIAEIDVLRAQAETQKSQAASAALMSEIHRLEMEVQTRAHHKRAEIEQLKRQAATLDGQLETAGATIARLQQEIEKHRLRAPASGRIGDVLPLQVGTYVAEGDRLGSVVPEGNLRIVADFEPSSVLGRIRPGQTALMRLDGFPWAQFGSLPAKVSQIASEIRDNRIRVEFQPEAPPESRLPFQHGLPGAIEVELERVAPAMLVLRTVGQMLAAPAGPPARSLAAAAP